jgi:hypothetical protein
VTRHAVFDEQNSLRLSTRREDAALYILICYSRILTRGYGAKVTIALPCFRFDLRVTFGFVCGGTWFLSRVSLAKFCRAVFTSPGLSW